MSELGNRIKQRRESLGMSQEELALKLGYKSRSSINKIEMEGRNLPPNKIADIAEALQTTPSFIMGWEKEEKPSIDMSAFMQIPLYESLSCGTGAFVDENITEFVTIPSKMLKPNKEYFANYASGDSMIGQNIYDGDLIIFEKCNTIESGQIGSFSINEEDATCKVFKKDARSGLIMLLPANNKYDPIPITEECSFFRVNGKLAMVLNNRQN